jgi:hypothetical protein
MNEHNIGDYGRFYIILRKKGYEPRGTDFVGTVTDIDKKFVWLIDNDGLVYCPQKTDVKRFEKM